MPRVYEYTIQDTGEVIQIKKVSPLLIMKLQSQFPEPKPPLQTVDYGDGPKQEPNPTAPEYKLALIEYQIELEKKIRRLMVERGVQLDWTEERKTALADLRAYWQTTYQEPLGEENDIVAYISYIAVGSDADYEELVQAIMQRSQPTEAKTAETLERLKS